MTIRTLDEFLSTIPEGAKRDRMVEVLDWVKATYPDLQLRIAWSTPMFTHHGTFIIGFSAAKMHMAVSPEKATMDHFADVMQELNPHPVAPKADAGARLSRRPVQCSMSQRSWLAMMRVPVHSLKARSSASTVARSRKLVGSSITRNDGASASARASWARR